MTDADRLAPLRVSDHALVRYLERVKGLPIDECRAEIRALAAAHRDEPGPVYGVRHDGLVLVIEWLGPLPVMVTILGPGERPKRRHQFGAELIYIPPAKLPEMPA